MYTLISENSQLHNQQLMYARTRLPLFIVRVRASPFATVGGLSTCGFCLQPLWCRVVPHLNRRLKISGYRQWPRQRINSWGTSALTPRDYKNSETLYKLLCVILIK